MSAESELRLLLTARDEASKVLRTATGEVEKYGFSFERILKPALLGVAAVTGIATGAAALFIQAAEKEQVASVQLTQALKNVGSVFSGEAPKSVEAYIASLEHMSGFSRVEVMDALGGLVEQTGSVTEAMSRESVAADLARARHIDLWTASKLLGKITDENVTALSRLGIVIPKGTSEAQAFAIVMRAVGGSAVAYGQTAAGQWEIFGNRMEDLKAKLGEKLLPVMIQVSQRLTEFIENVIQSGQVEKFAEGIRQMADSFFEAAQRVGAFFADISAVGLGDAIGNLLRDIVNKLREELPKLGAALDAMGPIGVAIKIALIGAAVSFGLGFADLLWGNLLGKLGTIAGFSLLGGGLGLAVTVGLGLGILIDQVIGPTGEDIIRKKLESIDWWRVALGGIFVASVLLGAGVPLLLAIPIAAVLGVTFETVFTGLQETQDHKNKVCEYALGPSAYWDGSKCVLPPQTISQSDADRAAGQAVQDAARGRVSGGPTPGGDQPQPDCPVGTVPFKWADGHWSCEPRPGGGSVRNLAEGAVVMPRPGGTRVNVGEGGSAEAIIPLDSTGGGALGGGDVRIENHFHGAVIGLDAVDDHIRQTIRDALASGGFRGLTGRRV